MLSYVIFFICLLIIFISGALFGMGMERRRWRNGLADYINILCDLNRESKNFKVTIEEADDGDDNE